MTVEIQGFCEERFVPLKEAFRANFDAGRELGASLGVTHQGRMVVDLWAGHADLERSRPWEKDTMVFVASTTKVMMTIAALMLVDRGLLDLDAPVARYWPEFAQGGKVGVTVRDVFTHRAGVPALDPPVPLDAWYDWDGMTARIAAERHWFDGRRQVTYHGITYGFLLGELIRRVDGRMPAQFFREEIAQDVGADFHVGLTLKSDVSRLADVRPPPPAGPSAPPGSLLEKLTAVADHATQVPFLDRTNWQHRSAQIPSANGYGNGRSIARVCAIIAMRGELGGVRYLSEGMVEQAATEQAYDQCPQFGWVKFGLGFGLDSKEYRYPSPTTFGWGGFGGSWALMDPKTGVSLGYAPNDFSDTSIIDRRQSSFAKALHKLLPTL